ncbi:hypothetical protein EC988_008614, partial [Linderina pennispora]
VLKMYFGSLFGSKPNFSQDFPTEPDWPRKAKTLVNMWSHDPRLEGRLMTHVTGCMVLSQAIERGTWVTLLTDWPPATCDLIRSQFTMRKTSRRQAELVHAMLQHPVNTTSPRKHPVWILAELTASSPDRLTFANARDWFVVHVLPVILSEWPSNENARAFLCQLVSSVDLLYMAVPWIDVATSLVQNMPMNNGPAVAFSPRLAKDKFVAYLSPLARVLLSIADYTLGRAISTVENTTEPEEAENDGDDDDGSENNERAFGWDILQQSLGAYLMNGRKAYLEDSLDAMLDVYTHTGSADLRRTIEK